jgi:hypothetical protein
MCAHRLPPRSGGSNGDASRGDSHRCSTLDGHSAELQLRPLLGHNGLRQLFRLFSFQLSVVSSVTSSGRPSQTGRCY